MLGFAFELPFCVPNFMVIGARVCVLYQFLQVCEKTKRKKKNEEKKRNFGRSYLGHGFSDFLQIWNVDSPSWRATLQQIWFQSNKVSPRYKSVKMTFSFFLSIYSRCGAPASWAARHTTVCLDLCRFYSHVESCSMYMWHCFLLSYSIAFNELLKISCLLSTSQVYGALFIYLIFI